MNASNKKNSAIKSASKVAKAEKASFEKVIIELEKEKEAFTTPKSQSKVEGTPRSILAILILIYDVITVQK
jgi:hypothetical protein